MENTFKYNIPTGLEFSASKDKTRGVLCSVYFDADNECFVASDGRILTTVEEKAD